MMWICVCGRFRRDIWWFICPGRSCTIMNPGSRGAEDSEEKIRRFQGEIEFMRSRWIGLLKSGDPYYNKNLTLSKWNYSLRSVRKYRRAFE